MKTIDKQGKSAKQIFQTKASEQAPIGSILNTYNNSTTQRQSLEEKPVQAKFERSSAIQLQAADPVVQRVTIDRIDVTLSGSMPQWDQNGLTYHLNLSTDPPHVTCENWPKGKGTTKMHFFFKRQNDEIKNAVSGQRGKKKFSDLPAAVQTFVANNYTAILAVT